MNEDALVPDCEVQNATFTTSPWTPRCCGSSGARQEEIAKSALPGIDGLDEARTYMLSPEGTTAAQQTMTRATLAHLMTPFLPPFYRLFMGGLVPSVARGDPRWLEEGFQRFVARPLAASGLAALLFGDGAGTGGVEDPLRPGAQPFGEAGAAAAAAAATPSPSSPPSSAPSSGGGIFSSSTGGGIFYAPALTSFVTPTFFGFLVGPSTINRRKDGQLGRLRGGEVQIPAGVELQGMCLNICKLPAQDFFREGLGLPLTVTKLETQECQWSFGEVPLSPEEDPAWPKGCVAGCPTRAEVRAQKRTLICE